MDNICFSSCKQAKFIWDNKRQCNNFEINAIYFASFEIDEE